VRSVVALWTAGPPGAAGASARDEVEFVRLAVAALAAGASVRAFDLRPPEQRGALETDEAQRLVARLAESEAGVRQGALGLREALAACDTVLRLGAPGRTGRPAMFVVTPSWLRTTTERELLEALSAAGQVVRR
jgi:hypothetical protein